MRVCCWKTQRRKETGRCDVFKTQGIWQSQIFIVLIFTACLIFKKSTPADYGDYTDLTIQ